MGLAARAACVHDIRGEAIMNRRVRAALAAVSFLAASLGAGAAQAFSDIYIFGDSLADSGNNAFIFDNPPPDPAWPFPAGYRTPVPLAPADIIPTAPYASNRYSNGPVWV